MIKLNKDKFKGFAIGVLSTVLLASTVGTAYAASKVTTIKVSQGGIKLYVDEKLIVPTDVKGNVIEPFIYDGTTYLPLRALSNALTNNEKEVTWDGKTSTIYVGDAPVAPQTDLAELATYSGSNRERLLTGEAAIIPVLDKNIQAFNRMYNGERMIYMLHSNYSSIQGQLIVPYTNLGNTDKGGVSFFNVDKKGNKTLIATFAAEAGDDPVPVHVDLRGVEILEIVGSEYDIANNQFASYTYYGSFYNITLQGAR